MSGFSSIGRMAKLCLSSHVTEQTAAEDWVLLLRSSDLALFAHLLLLVPVGLLSSSCLWDVVADRDLEHCKTTLSFTVNALQWTGLA